MSCPPLRSSIASQIQQKGASTSHENRTCYFSPTRRFRLGRARSVAAAPKRSRRRSGGDGVHALLVFVWLAHVPEMWYFMPQVIFDVVEVVDIKGKMLEILAAQRLLWAQDERVALQRGMQGGRNSGKAMAYAE